MILISHRGNLNGKSNMENRPGYIHKALGQDFDVEIDVWYIEDEFWLGHDIPQYKIEENFLENPRLWCHAKNIEGLYQMLQNKKIHCFFHQEDDVTLTSEGYMWTYTGKDLTKNSIAVLPDKKPEVEVAGICSDYIKEWL